MNLMLVLLALLALAVGLYPAIRVFGRTAAWAGIVTFGALFGWVVAQAPAVLDGTPVTSTTTWLPSLGLSLDLRMDALGLVFAALVLGVGTLVMAYGAWYFSPDQRHKAARYLSLLVLFAAAMLGLVLAADVIGLFLFWEMTSVLSFALIGGLGEGSSAARRAFLTTALGGLALLAGGILVSTVAGTSTLAGIADAGATVVASSAAPWIMGLLILAAATKSAQVPFHYWLPGAMVAPTPVSTYLHAATMVKAGIYLLFRFTPVFGNDGRWQITLITLGLTTAVFGAVVATRRNDLKSLLAYSTVSQLGMLAAAIGLGSPLAIAAATLHTLAHGMYKATLFMTAGVIDASTGTRDLRKLGGLAGHMPVLAGAAGLATLSMIGIPPLVGFVSKEEIFAAFANWNDPAWFGWVALTVAAVASVGTVVYSLRFFVGTFMGPLTVTPRRISSMFVAPVAVAGAAGLVLGVAVPWLDPVVNAVSLEATGVAADLHLALWHGVTTPLLVTLAVLTVGGIVSWRMARAGAADDPMLPAADVFDRIHTATLRFGSAVGRHAETHSPAMYLLPVVGVVLPAGAITTMLVELPAGPPPQWLGVDWAIVALLAVALAGVVQAQSRLAAVAALGLTGFTVAAWFVLTGAPDLALTQLLVETLTVTVVVMVFRRLPSTFPRGGNRRKVGAAAVATMVGLGVGGATYLLTGRRPISDTGARFLAEGPDITGGTNVVNTILVDFRALDTFGEITVIAVAALGIVAVVRMATQRPLPPPDTTTRPQRAALDQWGGIGLIDSPILHTAGTFLVPVMLLASGWLLLRGHNAVGGGFIGGLAGGAAVVLWYFCHGHYELWSKRWLRAIPIAGAGLLVAAGYGIGGQIIAGSFLAGGKVAIGPIHTGASLVFDIGVYLIVVAMVIAVVRHLGQGIEEDSPSFRMTLGRQGASS